MWDLLLLPLNIQFRFIFHYCVLYALFFYRIAVTLHCACVVIYTAIIFDFAQSKLLFHIFVFGRKIGRSFLICKIFYKWAFNRQRQQHRQLIVWYFIHTEVTLLPKYFLIDNFWILVSVGLGVIQSSINWFRYLGNMQPINNGNLLEIIDLAHSLRQEHLFIANEQASFNRLNETLSRNSSNVAQVKNSSLNKQKLGGE